MWPLLVCSVIAVTVVLERVIFLVKTTMGRKLRTVEQIFSLLENGSAEDAARAGRTYGAGTTV